MVYFAAEADVQCITLQVLCNKLHSTLNNNQPIAVCMQVDDIKSAHLHLL